MDPDRASVTAMAAALMRAVHSRADARPLIDDPWGEQLVTPEAVRAISRGGDLAARLRAHPAYGAVIMRTRYAEDALANAADRGVSQYVIVGAGMDSFALRQPAFARQLEIFEIDHPATQRFKRERLASCGIAPPPNLHFVAADLGVTALDAALSRSAFGAERLTFFSWLGVSVYLPRTANLDTLRAIAACAAVGSELVFDYVDQRVLDAVIALGDAHEARTRVAAVGEPWVSGFHPEELREDLGALGLELLQDAGPTELAARYCVGRPDSLAPSRGARLVHAGV